MTRKTQLLIINPKKIFFGSFKKILFNFTKKLETMSTSDLKLDLIKKIIDTDNIDLLLKINDLLESEENSSVNEPALKYENIRVFTAEEQRKIDIALKQVENGEYITDEEAQIEIEKWFEEEDERLSGL